MSVGALAYAHKLSGSLQAALEDPDHAQFVRLPGAREVLQGIIDCPDEKLEDFLEDYIAALEGKDEADASGKEPTGDVEHPTTRKPPAADAPLPTPTPSLSHQPSSSQAPVLPLEPQLRQGRATKKRKTQSSAPDFDAFSPLSSSPAFESPLARQGLAPPDDSTMEMPKRPEFVKPAPSFAPKRSHARSTRPKFEHRIPLPVSAHGPTTNVAGMLIGQGGCETRAFTERTGAWMHISGIERTLSAEEEEQGHLSLNCLVSAPTKQALEKGVAYVSKVVRDARARVERRAAQAGAPLDYMPPQLPALHFGGAQQYSTLPPHPYQLTNASSSYDAYPPQAVSSFAPVNYTLPYAENAPYGGFGASTIYDPAPLPPLPPPPLPSGPPPPPPPPAQPAEAPGSTQFFGGWQPPPQQDNQGGYYASTSSWQGYG